jgi:hypothetical protein
MPLASSHVSHPKIIHMPKRCKWNGRANTQGLIRWALGEWLSFVSVFLKTVMIFSLFRLNPFVLTATPPRSTAALILSQ